MADNGNPLSDRELAEVLDAQRLTLPSPPQVAAIKFAEYVDSTDEDALEVYVLVADDTSDDALTLDWADAVRAELRRALDEAGESRWAYFSFATQSEYDNRMDTGEAAA